VTPAATGAADSLCALTVMGGELVAVVGERDGDDRDGDRGLMTFAAADDGADELKAYTVVGTVQRKKFHVILSLLLLLSGLLDP